MQESEEIKYLLTEIRDAQRESLAEYRVVAQRSLDLQQQAVNRQEQFGKLYRRVLVVLVLVVGFVVSVLTYSAFR